MKKILYLVLVLCTITFIASGQVQPSPNSIAMARYGEIPVNYYTGIPSIGVPLHTLSYRGIKVPIALSYHASGIKLSDEASAIGLGWTLNAGGIITRVSNHLPDDKATMKYPPDILTGSGCDASQVGTYLENVTVDNDGDGFPEYDAEADIFYYNFCGYAGSFIIGKNGKILLKNNDKLKFEEHLGNSYRWRILTPDGTIYYFGDEDDATENYRDRTQGRFDIREGGMNFEERAIDEISTWHLRSIRNKFGENVNFSYVEYNIMQDIDIAYSYKYLGCFVKHDSYDPVTFQRTTVKSKHISSMQSENSKILFNYSTDTRQDLQTPTSNEPKRLIGLSVMDENDACVKKISFNNNHYFGTGDFQTKRLKLNAVYQESPIEPGNNILLASFNYNSTVMPTKNNYFMTDNWGYFSTQQIIYNADNVPIIENIYSPEGCGSYSNKIIECLDFDISNNTIYDVSESEMQASILNEITYPTGGKTIFEYETNDYYNGSVTKPAGGLRIKKLTKLTDPSTIVSTIKYNYELHGSNGTITSGHSSGVVASPPINHVTYHTVHPATPGYLNGVLGVKEIGLINQAPLGTTQGGHVGYKTVGVTEVNLSDNPNGKTVYYYNTSSTISLPGSKHFTFNKGNGSPGTLYKYVSSDVTIPIAPLNKSSWYLGRLSKVLKLNNSGQKVSEDIYSYNEVLRDTEYYTKIIKSSAQYDLYLITTYPYTTGEAVLASKTRKEYKNNYLILSTINSYTYSDKTYNYNGDTYIYRLLTSKNMDNSDGYQYSTKYRYILDFPEIPSDWAANSETLALAEMRKKFMVFSPIETLSLKSNNITHGSLQTFTIDGNRVCRYQNFSLNLSSPINYSSFSPCSTEILSYANMIFTKDSRYGDPELTYTYDNVGYLKEVSGKSGITKSFLYSHFYNKTTPVIIAENVDQATLKTEVSAALNETSQELNSISDLIVAVGDLKLSSQKVLWEEFNNKLRNKSNLSNAMITSMVTLPLIGPVSSVDPNKKVTYNYYDGFSRLIQLVDADGNIIQEYDYHLQEP